MEWASEDDPLENDCDLGLLYTVIMVVTTGYKRAGP
jgi:hypothetical protein